MKIPVPDVLRVAPEAARLPARGATQPTGYQGFVQAGQQLGQIGDQIGDEYQRELKKAQAKKTTDLVTQYQKAETDIDFGTTSTEEGRFGYSISVGQDAEGGPVFQKPTETQHTPGFLSTRGEGALAAVEERNKKLDEARKKIAEQATDPFVRDMFLEESSKLYEASRRRAMGHVATEAERAGEESLKLGLATMLKAAANDPLADPSDAIAGQAVRTETILKGRGKQVVDAAIDATIAEVAKARVNALLLKGEYTAAQLVVNGSRKSLGQDANIFDAKIKAEQHADDAQAEAQEIAANIAEATRTDRIFRPLDREAINAELAEVPAEKRKLAVQVMDELVARDDRRVKAEKERFVDSATSMYATAPGKFFGSTTANVLREVDPDKYLALEDRLRSLSRLARTEGRERQTLQTNLDKMAIDDLRAQLEVNPKLDTNKWMQEHPELSGLRVNEVNAIAAKAAKVYDAGLKPTQDRFVADFMAEASHKMPGFTGTPQQIRDQQAQWKRDRRAEAIDLYTDAMDANKGEKPEPDALTKKKAEAILNLPLTAVTPRALEANTRAITNLGAPPERLPEPPQAIRATGQTITMPDGSVYAVMSDKSTRLITPAKKKK